jgi:Sulfotransferase domain
VKTERSSLFRRLFRKTDLLTFKDNASFFHITHWKAGSQWMRAILDDLCGDAIVAPENFEMQLLARPVVPGKVYTCVYLSALEFQSLGVPAGSRRLVVIRDLRDTLISAYFSIRYSHIVDNPSVEKWRLVASKLNQEEGIIYLMEVWLNLCSHIQRGWLASGEPVFRLEDFMSDTVASLQKMFERGWGVRVEPGRLEEIASKHSFQKLSGGRQPGTEDRSSHYRNGTHGDWRNYFTPAIKDRFKTLYNDVLVMGGYEKDANW